MVWPIDLANDIVAGRVVDIQRAAYRIEADLIGFDGIPPLHEGIVEVRSHDLSWFGTWDGGELAGIIAWTDRDGIREIDRLAVHPMFHRSGHGRALVEHALESPRVVVSTGAANVPARALYEALGFAPIEQREVAPDIAVITYQRAAAVASP